MKRELKILDLFCGCGGLSTGFVDAGFSVTHGIDIWQDAIETFKLNHPQSKGLVADLSSINIKNFLKEHSINNIDVIIGGPPCQGFSIAGKRNIDDERNLLYKSFVEFVKLLKPKVFLIENVPNIFSMGKGIVKNNIIEDFEKLKYSVKTKILLASDYEVPQNRKRAFFIGSLPNNSFEFPLPKNKAKVNSKDAISDLPDENIIDGEKYPCKANSTYQRKMRKGAKGLYNHQLTNHEQKTIDTIALVPDGGNYKDLPNELKNTRKVNIAWTRLNSRKPSFTIDTGHRHHFHYTFNRVPTVRESARIQSFRDHFIFSGTKTSQYKQVGNAVPPILAYHIATNIKETFK